MKIRYIGCGPVDSHLAGLWIHGQEKDLPQKVAAGLLLSPNFEVVKPKPTVAGNAGQEQAPAQQEE